MSENGALNENDVDLMLKAVNNSDEEPADRLRGVRVNIHIGSE